MAVIWSHPFIHVCYGLFIVFFYLRSLPNFGKNWRASWCFNVCILCTYAKVEEILAASRKSDAALISFSQVYLRLTKVKMRELSKLQVLILVLSKFTCKMAVPCFSDTVAVLCKNLVNYFSEISSFLSNKLK